MSVVDIVKVGTRVKELLLACPRAARYTNAVGNNSRYTVNTEISDTALEVDLRLRRTLVEVSGHPLAAQYMEASDPLPNGTLIPAFVGVVADVYVDSVLSSLASSRDEILEIRNSATLYPNIGAWHFIENSVLYHTGTDGVVWRPVLTKTTACQIDESYEQAVIAGTICVLMKDGGDMAFYQFYANIYAAQEASIRGKSLVIPEAEAYQLAAA